MHPQRISDTSHPSSTSDHLRSSPSTSGNQTSRAQATTLPKGSWASCTSPRCPPSRSSFALAPIVVGRIGPTQWNQTPPSPPPFALRIERRSVGGAVLRRESRTLPMRSSRIRHQSGRGKEQPKRSSFKLTLDRHFALAVRPVPSLSPIS